MSLTDEQREQITEKGRRAAEYHLRHKVPHPVGSEARAVYALGFAKGGVELAEEAAEARSETDPVATGSTAAVEADDAADGEVTEDHEPEGGGEGEEEV